MLAECDEDDLAGVEDCADAHRDGLMRHVLFAEEVAGRIFAGDQIERYQPGTARAAAERLVEADVAVAADA